MQNRANISLIADLMAFREQVMTYYSSVVANRGTWECTVQANPDLRHYLAKSFELWLPTDPRRLAGRPPSKDGDLNIYNYEDDCQEKFGGVPSSSNLIIPATTGVGLRLQDHNDIPLQPGPACDTDLHHFCLKVEWEGLDPDQAARRGIEVKLTMSANRRRSRTISMSALSWRTKCMISTSTVQ